MQKKRKKIKMQKKRVKNIKKMQKNAKKSKKYIYKIKHFFKKCKKSRFLKNTKNVKEFNFLKLNLFFRPFGIADRKNVLF